MFVARSESSSRCIAWETEKDEAPFFCPECDAQVILKKGPARIEHFAHKPPVNCIYGKGETADHLRAKKAIYLALQKHTDCTRCEMERSLKGVRPDISLRIRGTPVAIEVQNSSIAIETIFQRSVRYYDLGISVMWVLPMHFPTSAYYDEEEAEVHRMKHWEKYIQALHFGRLYYWQLGSFVHAYHFKPFRKYVPESEWYNPDGSQETPGGYYQGRKDLREVCKLGPQLLDIAFDFVPKMHRKVFAISQGRIPICSTWQDNVQRWW